MNERIPLFSRPLPVVVLILLALLLDQAVKFAVETWLPFQEPVHVMPMLALYRTYNYGVAFSMLSGMEGWFIVTLRLFVVGFVIWLWRQTPKERGFAHAGYAFIIAGAFGIFGHGNVAGIGQALLQNDLDPTPEGERMRYIMPRNEQGMVNAAAAFAKATNRRQTWMCSTVC